MKHGVIVAQGEGYGRMFFLSKDMESSFEEFEQIWRKVGNLGENREKKDIGKES
jgi:hypothetical protein